MHVGILGRGYIAALMYPRLTLRVVAPFLLAPSERSTNGEKRRCGYFVKRGTKLLKRKLPTVGVLDKYSRFIAVVKG